jgi:3-oxoacyl-[acyl-carrier protein] reductase
MEISLKGKWAVVCGSSQGIGLATAKELALNGASCILLARNEEALQSAVSQLAKGSDLHHRWAVADFSDPSNLEGIIKKISAENRIQILINNSGGPKAAPLLEASTESFELAFRQHLICNQVMARTLVPGMKESGYGRIINIISTSVKTPLPGLGVSNTIRLAVAAWAKTLANEIGRFNITVNNILPGLTETQRLTDLLQHSATASGKDQQMIEEQMRESIPMKRFGRPEEIANMISFLASPAASYINGVNIAVDGGRTTAF